MNDWELVFSQARVNGGLYLGDFLPTYKWWIRPKSTWLQRKLAKLEKEKENNEAESLT